MAVSSLDQSALAPPHKSAESDSSTPSFMYDGDAEKNLSSSSGDEAAASVAKKDEGQRTITGFKVGEIWLLLQPLRLGTKS